MITCILKTIWGAFSLAWIKIKKADFDVRINKLKFYSYIGAGFFVTKILFSAINFKNGRRGSVRHASSVCSWVCIVLRVLKALDVRVFQPLIGTVGRVKSDGGCCPARRVFFSPPIFQIGDFFGNASSFLFDSVWVCSNYLKKFGNKLYFWKYFKKYWYYWILKSFSNKNFYKKRFSIKLNKLLINHILFSVQQKFLKLKDFRAFAK